MRKKLVYLTVGLILIASFGLGYIWSGLSGTKSTLDPYVFIWRTNSHDDSSSFDKYGSSYAILVKHAAVRFRIYYINDGVKTLHDELVVDPSQTEVLTVTPFYKASKTSILLSGPKIEIEPGSYSSSEIRMAIDFPIPHDVYTSTAMNTTYIDKTEKRFLTFDIVEDETGGDILIGDTANEQGMLDLSSRQNSSFIYITVQEE